MLSIRLIDTGEPEAQQQLDAFRRASSLDTLLLEDSPELRVVTEIVEAVRQRGDEAVAECSARFDHVDLVPAAFRIPASQIEAAGRNCDPQVREAIRTAAQNVRKFQEHMKIRPAGVLCDGGRRLEARIDPIRRVGICVPGMSAPLPSSVIMTAVPAQVA